MTLLIATDAWYPQVNGVVRALSTTAERLRARGWAVEMMTPDQFRTIPCPTYPEIRLAVRPSGSVNRRLDALWTGLSHVHIATEGPIGVAVRRWCLKNGFEFTTSFHTRFADYVALRTRVPAGWIWPMLTRFHGKGARTMAATALLEGELRERGIGTTHRWPLGVDIGLFRPGREPHPLLAGLPGPLMLSVGRVALEKNLEAFLSLDVPGTKVIVGDGPDRAALAQRYPDARFLGARHGEELAAIYAGCDVFVFASRTDTFGLVNVEALASGVPVAAYPVRGPIDIIGSAGTGTNGGRERIGALDEDLGAAIARALGADPAACAREAQFYDWERCTDAFVAGLEPVWPELSAAA